MGPCSKPPLLLPLRLIAHRFAAACGYGSAALGELAAASDQDACPRRPGRLTPIAAVGDAS